MSKKMIRNSVVVRFAAGTAFLWSLLVACGKTTDGDGSESHFVACARDSDCNSVGSNYVCVDKECAPADTLEAGSGGGTGAAGGGAGNGGGGATGGNAESGATAGSQVCINETRSTPYTSGMVVTGSTGVTVALVNTPASQSGIPATPSLGDNDWRLTVKDAAGTPVTGATLTVTEFMPDHGHRGAKAVIVTELGGGEYDANPVNFNMSGYWEVTVEVQKAPLDEKVTFKLCIE
jgi:hypothetical protein